MIVATKAALGSASFGYFWVAVGANGTLYTNDSDTLASGSWTSRTSSFGTTSIIGVASNGVNLLVAVGGSGTLATSPDGVTWTQQTSSFGSTGINAVAFGNNIWVAVGNSGKIATSTDGVTWTQRTSGTTSALNTVQYGDGIWVVGGDAGLIRTATDPTATWTARTSTIALAIGRGSVCYFPAGDMWVAGSDAGTSGALASSPDGITWTARNSAYSLSGGAFVTACNTSAVVATELFATTAGQSSTNGTTWTSRTLADATAQSRTAASDNKNQIAVGGQNDALSPTAWNFQYSTDGITWTDANGPSVSQALFCLCHSTGVQSIR